MVLGLVKKRCLGGNHRGRHFSLALKVKFRSENGKGNQMNQHPPGNAIFGVSAHHFLSGRPSRRMRSRMFPPRFWVRTTRFFEPFSGKSQFMKPLHNREPQLHGMRASKSNSKGN
mmetsp:Transcript_13995/g.32443  ORF Transcript_13995/g.32443 Transcript_13995/m.32443 type:complete len:115 (-) Transcript_13995:192-536(-)